MSLILIENAAHSVKKLTVLRSFNLKRNECIFFLMKMQLIQLTIAFLTFVNQDGMS